VTVKRWVSLALGFALTLAAGCQRKAAGVPECRLLAYRMYGVRDDQLLGMALRKQVDDRIRECLLTPYDRELVSCLEQGLRERACVRAFEARHSLASDEPNTPRFR
jgi:hypothetical protein